MQLSIVKENLIITKPIGGSKLALSQTLQIKLALHKIYYTKIII